MDIYDWQRSLWKYIEEQLYTPQKPLYLSFHEQILDEIYCNTNQSSEVVEGEAVKSFVRGCNHFLIPQAFSIYLDPKIWESDDRGLSLAICYAVQQILAVEGMNARSFYEPYIELMDASSKIQIEYLHKNPLSYNFEKIWRIVSSELQTHLECEQSQITFKQGRGKNKLRNYPFSQSLLSEKELYALSERFPLTRRKTEVNARHLILRQENCLTNRSKKKLSNNEYIDRISQQFVAYLKHDTHVSIQNSETECTATKHTFEIICITEGFEPDFYELLSRYENLSPQAVTSFDQLKNSFSNGFSLFLSTNAGRWVSSSISGKKVSDFRSMILGIDLKWPAGLVESIANELDVEPVCIDLKNSIHEAESVVFYEIPLYGVINQDISIDKLFLEGITSLQDNSLAKIKLEGGLVVDARKNRFLISYPPTRIIFLGYKLSSNEEIEVNDEKMTVGHLFTIFRNVRDECNFNICHENASITIGFEKIKFDLSLEMPINQIINDKLNLSKSLLTESMIESECDPYFSHLSIYNYIFGKSFQVNPENLLKYSFISCEYWVSLPHDPQLFDVFSDLLKKGEFPYLLEEFVNQIIRTKKIPYPLLLEITVT